MTKIKQTDPLIEFYEHHAFPNNKNTIQGMHKIFTRLQKHTPTPITTLSIGCGTGEELTTLKTLYPSTIVTALEPSTTSRQHARNTHPQTRIHPTTIEEYEPNEKYDLIICQGVLHHLKEPPDTLSHILGLLNDEGCLWLGVYHHAKHEYDLPELTTPQHYADHHKNPREKTYSHESFFKLIRESGGYVTAYAHPLPKPRGRIWKAAYDALFIWKKQPLMWACVKISTSTLKRTTYRNWTLTTA